jgi:hypothetical protein
MGRHWAWTALVCPGCLALGFGAGAAWVLETQVTSLKGDVLDSLTSYLGCRAVAEYRCGGYARGRAALLSHLKRIEPRMTEVSGAERVKYARSVALTYSRLAVAAGRASVPDDRALFLAKARDAWAAQGDHLSELEIDARVRTIDAACAE